MHYLRHLPLLSLLAASSLLSSLASPAAWAQQGEQCVARPDWLVGLPAAPAALPRQSDIHPAFYQALEVSADSIETRGAGYASFQGDVAMRYGNQRIFTEAASFNQQANEISATGGVIYSDGYVAVRGTSLQANTQQQSARLEEIEYHLDGAAARGAARALEVSETSGVRTLGFEGSSFTTCPGDRPAWEVRAQRIEMNEDENWGRAEGAQIRLFNIPVIYVPRFSFPLTDERKSGLLYPTITSSARNGLDITAPYYFNLAANYDATVAPRYMSQRGTMAMVEGRYLSDQQEGQVNVEFLNRDNDSARAGSRSFWRVEHNAHLNQHWSTYVDASSVSDVNYFNDFGSEFANRADSHIYRRGQVDYYDDRWQAQLQIEDFQLLGPYQSAFRTLPRLSFDYDTGQPIRQGMRYDWLNEITHFQRQDGSPEKATRLHSEAGARYSFNRPGWSLTSEGRMLVTHYEQQILQDEQLRSRAVTRVLPEFRTHGQLNFERSFEWGEQRGLQTLQPQAQFLYTPYRDQRDIGIYDSVPLQDDYNGLFRQRRFSGLDRIADANQLTLGATTSIFNQQAEELVRLSAGQIFYFDDSETQLFDGSTQITDNASELAAEVDFRISSRWFVSAGAQYDSQLNQMQKSRSAVEYRKDDSNLVQLNFRQVRGLIGTETDVEQLGLLGTWQLKSQWSAAGHVYRDIGNHTTLDASFGVQYESCCWAIRVSAYRRIDRNFEGVLRNQAIAPAEFDNGISLQFVITGLGADRSSLSGMLQQGIFGYRRPFYLNN